MRRVKTLLLLLPIVAALLCSAPASAVSVELLAALRSGMVTGEFRGAGDSGVTATIVRQTPEPLQVVVSPGTVFRVQFGGDYQGISTFGPTSIDLTRYQIARVFIPGGCANFGLRAPTPNELMVAMPPPNARMAKLAQAMGTQKPEHAVAQIALWAVANNVPKWAARRYVARTTEPGTSRADIAARSAQLLSQAEALVKKAGLDPKKFRTFR